MLERMILDALRASVLLAFALLAMPLLRRASAATRRLVLVVALGAALVLPLASAVAPSRLRVEAPAAATALRGIVVTEPLVPRTDPPAAETAARGASRTSRRVAPADAVMLGWLLGALLVLARLVVGLVRARALVQRASHAPSWAAAAERASTDVPVRMTTALDSPAVAGLLRPVVLVPAASTEWSEERRHVVLLHELAHVRQRDGLVHVLAQVVCALHWFNPLAWMVARRLRVERELAADDAVVLAGAHATAYAEDLLAIASDLPQPSGTLGMAARSELAARIVAIVAADRARKPAGRAAQGILAAIAAGAATLLACTTPAAPERAPQTTVHATTAGPAPASSTPALDARLQAIATEEIERTVQESHATAGIALVLDPANGEVLAEAGRARGPYLTGSTLKAVTLAAALEEGVVSPTETIDCERGSWTYGGKKMTDYEPFGRLEVPAMLAVSSNIGFAKVFDRLGARRFEHWVRAFHFDGGHEPIADGSFDGAVAAIGQGMPATPLQVAAAYAALANDGVYVAPTRALRTGAAAKEQLVRPETARSVVAMLEGVVNREKATGTLARVDGARVAGKTGTAEWRLADGSIGTYASFVGIVPASAPRFVILVGVEQPRPSQSGGKVAAPAFARIASRALK